MKLFRNLAIVGGLVAFAGIASAASIVAYDQTLTPPPGGTDGFYAGTGISAQHFTTLTDGNLQLALSIHNRFTGSPAIVPDGNNYDYNTSPNVGPQQWGLDFSIDTRAGGGIATLGDYTFLLEIFDNTTGTPSVVGSFNPLSIADNAFYGSGGIDEGSSHTAAFFNGQYGVQNSEWPGWGFLFGPTWNPSDSYSISLTATPTIGGDAQSLAITVNAPEPGTIGMMLGSLGLLGVALRRRKA